jgi:aryl-alcohol dehydrogenase-like predicted oxidoreductase
VVAAPPRASARIALGAAQWGMPYGIANRSGLPPRDELVALLGVARRAGVDTLDTARAYGESEARIGELTAGDPHWRIATKLAPDVDAGADLALCLRRADESLEASRRARRRERLDLLLLHRARHRTAFGGALFEHLLRRQEQGWLGALGASASSPQEALALLEDPAIEVLQVAASLLDRRLAEAGFFARAAGLGKRVFVRSVFLQGVAHLSTEALPGGLSPLARPLQLLDDWAKARGIQRADAFLLYARECLDAPVVLGCETAGQLCRNLVAWRSLEAPAEELHELARRLGPIPEALLDPSRWQA